MLGILSLIFFIIALAVLCNQFTTKPEDDWSCYSELDNVCPDPSSDCDPAPTSWNSCCSRNPIIASQIRNIIAYSGKLCQGTDTSGCLCLPNIGSIYVGASIASTRDTVPYQHPEGLATSALTNKPILSIEPTALIPGVNWHFVGSNGTIVIKLFRAAQISGVTVIHPAICRIPPGFEKSAPKDFQVMGLQDLDEKKPFQLGNYTYDVYKGQGAQTFPVQRCTTDKFQLIEFRFTANHGNPEYTALYKIQIHGDMSDASSNNNDDDDGDDGDE